MTSKPVLFASALLGALVSLNPASAQPNDAPLNVQYGGDREQIREREALREINGRIRAASDHIERAVRRGRLDGRETQRLRREVQEIRMTEERMQRDGRVDRREREVLHHRLDALERHIRKELRD